MRVAELKALAQELKLRLDSQAKKDDIIDVIVTRKKKKGGAAFENVVRPFVQSTYKSMGRNDHARMVGSIASTSKRVGNMINSHSIARAKNDAAFERFIIKNAIPNALAKHLYANGYQNEHNVGPFDWERISQEFVYYPIATVHVVSRVADLRNNAGNAHWKFGDILVMPNGRQHIWVGKQNAAQNAASKPAYVDSIGKELDIPAKLSPNYYNFYKDDVSNSFSTANSVSISLPESIIKNIYNGFANNMNDVFFFEYKKENYAVIGTGDPSRLESLEHRKMLWFDEVLMVDYDVAKESSHGIVHMSAFLREDDDRLALYDDEIEMCQAKNVPLKNIMFL
jgi:hypothetical protein